MTAPIGLAAGVRGGWQQSRSERASAAAMVILLHAAAVAVVMLARETAPGTAQPGLVAFNVAADAAPAPRPQPSPHHRRLAAPLPTTAALIPRPTEIAVVPSVPDPNLMAIPNAPAVMTPAALVGGACDLTGPVQDALRRDDQLARLLPAIPAAGRSVANAIVVWNHGWITPQAAAAQPAYGAIRQAISLLVASSSPDCRNQLQTGPRLLYLPTAGKTTVLALGSGQWSWQQVIDGAQPLPAATLAQAQTGPLFASQRATAQPAPNPSPAPEALLASLTASHPPPNRP